MADQQQQGVTRDYRKGNWTVSETMVLIEAKRMDEERRTKRTNGGGKPTELRWKWVEDYCWRKGCPRSQNQCNDKWDNLMRDYKKVRDYERKKIMEAEGGGDGDGSYWKLEKNERKERNLPSNLLFQIYEALVEVVERREGGGSGSTNQRVVVVVGGGYQHDDTHPANDSTRPSHLVRDPSSRVQVSMAPPSPHLLLQYQVSSSTTSSQVMPLLPPPPPPILPSQPQPPTGLLPCSINPWSHPLPSVDSEDSRDAAECSGSPAKRRRRRSGNNGGEGTSTGPGRGRSRSLSSHHDHDDDDHHQVGNAISRSASIIAEAIHGCEERKERRHRDLMALHERRLRVEESKTEMTRQGINGLVEAINNLATSILSLTSSHNNKNQPSSS